MKYKVALNNKIYEVEVEDGKAMLLDEYEAKAPAAPAAVSVEVPKAASAAPAAGPAAAAGTQVKAPLPGNVMSVKVSEGQTVKAGDILVVIEAMKMENEVLAPCDGKVVQILKAKGTSVATGDILMVI